MYSKESKIKTFFPKHPLQFLWRFVKVSSEIKRSSLSGIISQRNQPWVSQQVVSILQVLAVCQKVYVKAACAESGDVDDDRSSIL